MIGGFTRQRIAVIETDVTRDRMLALRDVLRSHAGDCEVVVHVTIPGLMHGGLCRVKDHRRRRCREPDPRRDRLFCLSDG